MQHYLATGITACKDKQEQCHEVVHAMQVNLHMQHWSVGQYVSLEYLRWVQTARRLVDCLLDCCEPGSSYTCPSKPDSPEGKLRQHVLLILPETAVHCMGR